MKQKEKTKLLALAVTELEEYCREAEQKLMRLRLEKMTKPKKNVREQKNLRRSLAVIKTILQKKRFEGAL